MSQLSDLVSAGRDVIPEHILSKPGLLEIGKAEVYFAQRYLAEIAQGCAGLPHKLALEVLKDAKEDIKLAQFGYGGTVFELWAMARSSVPFLTLLSLQVRHGDKVDLAKVAEFYEKGDADAIAAKTWELWGFAGGDKKKDGGAAASPPTGTPSSDGSAVPPPATGSETPPAASDTPPSSSDASPSPS